MKKYFLSGLITLLPLALTIIIALYLIDLLTTPFVGLIENLIHNYEQSHGMSLARHHLLVLIVSRLVVLCLLFFFILLLGYLTRKFFFNAFLRITTSLFARIPFIRGVYRISKDVIKALFAENTKPFKRTVLIPFPHPLVRAIGFVTGDAPPAINALLTEPGIAVFVPTAPHPLSGFILLTPESLIQNVDITTEEAFRFLISCGVVHPKDSTPHET